MSKLLRVIFILILLFSIYHLVRDILQIINLENIYVNVLHRQHIWCSNYCDYVTIPFDLIGILGSSIVLKKNKLGYAGLIVLFSMFLWIIATILP
jgi:hypothetical protein